MTTFSEVYTNNRLQLHHIIPLDFNSLQAVPDSHIWPKSDDDVPTSDEYLSIPIVDLMDPDVVDRVSHACQTWGIFQVTNHGLSPSLLEGVEEETWRLFSLPVPEKMKVLRLPDGATGYGTARIAPFYSKSMWHEGFTIMGGSFVEHAKVLWPNDYKRFCDVIDECQKSMKTLAHKLLHIILKSLNLSEEQESNWATKIHQSETNALQLNSYPTCPDPNQAIGLPPHTDSLLLTILHHSNTSGLQIFRDGGFGWVPVSSVPGALTVNVGDLLHILSNGKFPTVYHRVVVSGTCHRVSMGYFYGLPVDSTVEPLSKVEFPMYKSLTVREYIGIKNECHEKALSLIRI
ncbi:Gibberellin 3-beta-dioxygenase 1 [Camellia lanceoleosa]|uniref:Gibberellin 3-beta-dioxygenase 1 n=1 Tax=Camellia lanceoleosa TaxID=1840588 RepID=A0ACC0FFL4_9ERIC|nr:Gibberellin 3-beta-dioxygenase 1 [Camellia lanceoleosa]